MVALSVGGGATALEGLSSLDHAPGAAGHSGPFPLVYTMLKANGYTVRAVVEGRNPGRAVIDRPLVTSGGWVRPGGVVVERGFARALGVRVGGRITVAGRAFQVAGIAVTAASTIYPWAELIGQDGGQGDYSGLV